MANTVTTTTTASPGPTVVDAFTADRQAFWSSFTRFVTLATIGVVVLLIVMAFFLV